MLRIERAVLITLLAAAISGGVVMYREVGVTRAMVEQMASENRAALAEVRGEIRRLNNIQVNHERRPHGQRMP